MKQMNMTPLGVIFKGRDTCYYGIIWYEDINVRDQGFKSVVDVLNSI